MASENEAAPLQKAIAGQVEPRFLSTTGDESIMLLVADVARTLPPLAVKDLLSIGVCVRCIFRLFGVSECFYSCSFLSPLILFAALGKVMGLDGVMGDNVSKANKEPSNQHSFGESELEPNPCRICLGILQFSYCDDKGTVVKRVCANDFAVLIAEVVKQEGHQIENFSLEISIPTTVMENEQAVRLYMKGKYDSESWLEKFLSEQISAKDFLKLSVTAPLEILLVISDSLRYSAGFAVSFHNVQMLKEPWKKLLIWIAMILQDTNSSLGSSFRIRLTYTHSEESIKVQSFTGKKECNKRRKIAGMEHSDSASSEENVSNRSFNGLHNHDSTDSQKFQFEKVCRLCCLTILCYRTPVYIGGRYLKYSRNVSQTRWIIDDERMGEASVEEIIACNILPICRGDSYKFHAAGREDIDVRMLGSGRPFLVEIQNARHVPSEMSIKEIEGKINSLEKKLVRVKNIKVLGSQGWSLMREGEAEKQPILQRTPIRVLHRRSPLERQKIIHWMKIEQIAGSSQYFLLHLCTQAGTYIKEFVHGDLGRTHPSIGSILGCRAEIVQLDVTDVKMDCFLP
ncbi:uncharacterized protein LOC127808451 isoform X3 [Diospyros lotus]|uniref:uncharacterized protein LOC127808451 isoform X3 n=1 Tax=Diospyros lotus TaxID=55363 RepID=UPI0022525857|nr:uncharacterized protein LOC127808451 isoform X3 [Diospyros lotus]